MKEPFESVASFNMLTERAAEIQLLTQRLKDNRTQYELSEGNVWFLLLLL